MAESCTRERTFANRKVQIALSTLLGHWEGPLGGARLLQRSGDPHDWQLGADVEAFVKHMPARDPQRVTLAREFRAASRQDGRSIAPQTANETGEYAASDSDKRRARV